MSKSIKSIILICTAMTSTGCIMAVLSPDLSKANWFGCKPPEVLKPTTRGMFGTNKGNAECLKPDDPRYLYYKQEKTNKE